MIFYPGRKTRFVLAWIAFSSVISLPRVCSQPPGKTINLVALKELLRSKKIHELRQACRIIESHPQQAMPLLPIVLKRSNHPELTALCERMLEIAPPDQIRQQYKNMASDGTPFIRRRIEQTLRRRAIPTTTPQIAPQSSTALNTAPANSVPAERKPSNPPPPSMPSTGNTDTEGSTRRTPPSESEIVQIIKRLDPNPTDVIPALLTVVEDPQGIYAKSTVTQNLALYAIQDFGGRAANALPRLQKIADSKNGSMAFSVRSAIEKIQREL